MLKQKNRQGYGRRKPGRAAIVDSCFTFSSPAKETKTIEIREDKVVELLDNLTIEDKEDVRDDEPNKKTRAKHPAPENVKEKVLGPRDPNERRALRLSGGLPRKKNVTRSPQVVAKSIVPAATIEDEAHVATPPEEQDSAATLEVQPTAVEHDIPIRIEHDIPIRTKEDHDDTKPTAEPPKTEAKKKHTRKIGRSKKLKDCQSPSLATSSPPIPLAPTNTAITDHAQPLLSLCNDEHTRTGPLDFQAWADSLSSFLSIKKIAEASYGEVFRLSLLSTVGTKFTEADESVLKLIALKPPPSSTNLTATQKRKQAAMSAVEHVASEARMLKHMSLVPGMTNFRDLKVVQGRLPKQFVAAWKHYDTNVRKSLFIDPSRKSAYEETQLWAVVEMQDAGTDLEGLLEVEQQVQEDDDEPVKPVWRNISVWAAWDIFWSTACAIAKGESYAEFEHRDLHLGNICIRSNDDKTALAHLTALNCSPSTSDKKLGFTPLETTIIDYTLSRANMTAEDLATTTADIAYLDLSADPALFEGNAECEYQYEIYRLMRGEVLFDDPTMTTLQTETKKGKKAGTRGKKAARSQTPAEQQLATPSPTEQWRAPHLMTNLIWLHFVLHKLLSVVKMPHVCAMEGEKREEEELAAMLYDRLAMLDKKRLAPRVLKQRDWSSATDLLAWVVKERWLDEGDVGRAGLKG